VDSRWTYRGRMAKIVAVYCGFGAAEYQITHQADLSEKEVQNKQFCHVRIK